MCAYGVSLSERCPPRFRSAVRRPFEPLVPAIGVTVTIANACSDFQGTREITGHSGELQCHLPCQCQRFSPAH